MVARRTYLIGVLAVFIIIFSGSKHDSRGQGTANNKLASVAASMQPGTFALLNQSGDGSNYEWNSLLIGANLLAGPLDSVLSYAQKGVYDPVDDKVYFTGSPHDTNPDPAYIVETQLSYDVATNHWTLLQPAPVLDPAGLAYWQRVGHAYDTNAINVAGREIYHSSQLLANGLNRFNLTSHTYVSMTQPDSVGFYPSDASAEFFPERNELLWVQHNGFGKWNPNTNTWSYIATLTELGFRGPIARYSPPCQCVVVIGGNDTSPMQLNPPQPSIQSHAVYKYDKNGTITRMGNAPPSIWFYDQQAITGVDPVSGNLIVINAVEPELNSFTGVLEMWSYNPLSDTWTALNPSVIPDTSQWWEGRGNPSSIVVTPISKYGVIMIMSAVPQSNSKVYLYKPTTSGGTVYVADTTSPSVPTNVGVNIASSSQVNVSWTASTDNVGVAGYKIYRNGTQIATSTATNYSDTGLSASTTYAYAVSAYDAAGNNSSQSAAVSGTTLAATTATSQSFAQKCAASAVVGCYGFDSASDVRNFPTGSAYPLKYSYDGAGPCGSAGLGTNYGAPSVDRLSTEATVYAKVPDIQLFPSVGPCEYPHINTSVPHSGAGALELDIPASQSIDVQPSGYFDTTFQGIDHQPNQRYGGPDQGGEIYIQFYYRTHNILEDDFSHDGFGNGFLKSVIICSAAPTVDHGGCGTDPTLGSVLGESIGYAKPSPTSNARNGLFSCYTHYLTGSAIYSCTSLDNLSLQNSAGCLYNGSTPQVYMYPPCVGTGSDTWKEVTLHYKLNPIASNFTVSGSTITRTGTFGTWSGSSPTEPTGPAEGWVGRWIYIVGDTGTGSGFYAIATQPDANHITVTGTPSSGSGKTIYASAYPNSLTEMWIDGTKIISDNFIEHVWDQAATGWGQIRLLTHFGATAHDTTHSLNSYVLYDDLIVSTQPIAMASGSVATSGDNVPPTVSITAPATGISVSGASVAVSASASDNIGVVGVQFKVDGANIGSEITTAPYSIMWNTTQQTNGAHTLTAVARDAAGNQTTSAGDVITVMNANPTTISITAPANGATVSGTSVTVSANASNTVGIAGVQFKLDGTNLGAEKTTAPYATTWDTTQVANGSHVLTAVARDTAGNLTTSAALFVTISNTNPTTVSITAPSSGATVSGTSVTVSANAVNTAGIAGVQFKLDGVNLGAEKTTAPYAITWDTTQVANGSHVLTAVARDTAGNLTTSAALSVTISNTNPTSVSITAPSSGATVSGTSVTVSANASNTAGIAGVQFKLDGVNLGAEKTTAPYAITWDTTQVANGSHVLTAVARDTAGNLTTSAGLSVTISNTSATTVAITAPSVNTTVSGTSVTVSAYASNTAGIAGVQFKLDGANLGAEKTTAPYSITWNTTQTTNGSHSLTAVARDASGNFTASSAVTVTVSNNSGPDTIPPTVSITAPATNTIVSGSSVPISASASDNVGVVGVQLKVDGVNLGPEQTGAAYAFLWDTTQVSNGFHTLTAVARDNAGNQATSGAVFVNVSNASTTAGSSVPYSLSDRGTDLLMENSTSGSINVGYARVQTDAGSSALGGAAIFSYHSDGAVVSETSVPLSPLVQSGRMYVEMKGPVSTGVAFANPNTQDAVISFYFTDTSGNNFGYAYGSFTLGANRQMSGFLNQAPFNLPDNTEGSFTFTSTIGVSMVALRGFTNERNVFLMSTVPVPTLDTTNASPLAVLPHFAVGGGWTTKLVLVNPTDAALSGNAQFFSPADGYSMVSPLTLTVNGVPMSGLNYSIPAHGVFAVTLNSIDGLATGSIRITASNGSIAPSGMAIFSLSNNGVTVSEASVPIAPPAFALRVYVESQGTPAAVGSSQTGIALANPTSAFAVANLELIQADGTSTGMSASVMIPPGGQMARFLKELIPGTPDTFNGVLRVSSANPINGIGLRLTTNGGGDYLMSTIPAVSEIQSGAFQQLLFPHIVSGGGFTTELILLNRQPAATSSGEVIFTGQDGSPISLQ